MREANGTFTRFHLRVEADGRGMLLANATAAARLSESGVMMAKGLLDKKSDDEIIQQLKQNFRGASTEEMQADLERVAALVTTLAAPGDNYPIVNFEDAEISPFEAELMAPFQADSPLAPFDRLAPILDRLWEAGIPQAIILVNDKPAGQDLVHVVERAEDLGMIAGVRGRASDLGSDQLVTDLAAAGLDHFNIVYASADPKVHDAILGQGDHQLTRPLFASIHENVVALVAEIPLIDRTSTLLALEDTLIEIQKAGIHNVNFWAIAAPDEMADEERAGALTASAMPQTADIVEEKANQSDVRFIWQPPVLRDPSVSISQQVRLGARCSSDLSIRVEPNGDVIPPRGLYVSAGNILQDDWETIWGHEAFVNYRTRVERPTRCNECPGLAICAVDCPRKMKGWSQGRGSNQ
jgi:radical SAM protein with 4Fe4S-binding SPASM domain